MQTWHETEVYEPDGHFGGLTVADVMMSAAPGKYAVQVGHIPPGGGGHNHAHDEHVQLFFVIEGRMRYWTGDDTVEIGPMEAIRFDPGVDHATLNEGDTDATVLTVTIHTG